MTQGPTAPAGLATRTGTAVSWPVALALVGGLLALVVSVGLFVGYRYFWGAADDAPRTRAEFEVARWQYQVKQNPKEVGNWLGLGVAHMLNKDYEGAEKAFKQGLQREPRSPEARFYLGALYMEQKEYRRAEPIYKELAQETPSNALVHYQLARIFIEEGQHDRALERLNFIVERLDRTYGDVYYLRGLIYEKEKLLAKAIDEYREALRFDPAFQPARDALKRAGLTEKDLPPLPKEAGGARVYPVQVSPAP